MKEPDNALSEYFESYEPTIADLGRALRRKLRKRLSGLHEIVYVYAGQKALVISYSPSEHGYEGVCSLALYPSEVKLHFGRGAELKSSDSAKLLRGSGKTVRHVALASIADFERPEMETLIVAALRLAKLRTQPSTHGKIVDKAPSQRERAERKAKSSPRKQPARRTRRGVS